MPYFLYLIGLRLLFLTLSLIVTLSLSTHSGLANEQNKTLVQPRTWKKFKKLIH